MLNVVNTFSPRSPMVYTFEVGRTFEVEFTTPCFDGRALRGRHETTSLIRTCDNELGTWGVCLP